MCFGGGRASGVRVDGRDRALSGRDADAPAERTGGQVEFAADEIRAALTWTRRKADTELGLALRLAGELRPTWRCLHGGRIDLGRTWVINNATSALHDCDAADAATLAGVQDKVLDYATSHTTGQVAANLRRLILIADPDAAQKRYEDAVAERRVALRGCRTMMAAATCTASTCRSSGPRWPGPRIEAFAKVARLAGDIRTIDQIRADVYLDLLCGHHSTGTSTSTSNRGDRDSDRGTLPLAALGAGPCVL